MKISIIKSKIKTLITVTVSCLLFSCQTEEKVTLYFNAEVITMAEDGRVVGAMAVQSGVIVAVGSYEVLKSQFPKSSQVERIIVQGK